MVHDPPDHLGITAADLSPGDARAVRFDWTGVDVRFVRSIDDPDFVEAYAALWAEFGENNELESRDVLARRMPGCHGSAVRRRPVAPDTMRYDFVVVRRGSDLAAVADHTTVVGPGNTVVVHVSHVLVLPPFRGSGLAGWVRAIVDAIYAVYGDGLREPEMRVASATLNDYPPDDAAIDLVAPSLVLSPVVLNGRGLG